MPQGSFLNLWIALSLLSSASALAIEGDLPLLSCTDNLRSANDLEEAEKLRLQIAADEALKRGQESAFKEVTEILKAGESAISELVPSPPPPIDYSPLVQNPIFSEALSRSLSLAGIKRIEEVEAFKVKLSSSAENVQIDFANIVIRQYDALIEQALAWVDEDQFHRLESRWNLSRDEAFSLFRQWMTTTVHSRSSDVALAALVWIKSVDAERIAKETRALSGKGMKKLLEVEEAVFTRIRSPHSLRDLAMNNGPISDREFTKQVRTWSLLGWSKHRLNAIRRPGEATFVLLLSLAPVSIAHLVLKDWNLTNTIATIIGGVATCPPLIAKMAKNAINKQRDTVFLDLMTLRQLSEMKKWMNDHPGSASALGFKGLERSIDQRIELLRQLRYSQL